MSRRITRTVFRGRVSSWNVRDSHMAEPLEPGAQWLTEEAP
jgi:hypothetical protein